MANFDDHFHKLENFKHSGNVSCANFLKLLNNMGFEIINCRKAGHKIAKHPAICLQNYPDFNCGHKKGDTVKAVYIRKLYNFIDLHKETIKKALGE